MKDGWHTILGREVLVENGYVVRGVKRSTTGVGKVPAYVYWWYPKMKVWNSVKKVTPAAFRAGVTRGTYDLF